ncbi:MAG: helix-turn-helix domain-containing protein [Lachnospiraceae bacterium]
MYLNQKLNYTSRGTTVEKLLAYLSDQAGQNGSNEFVIPFNRQQLADFLGVERSAMSAEISKLVKLGILETKRSYFKLHQI